MEDFSTRTYGTSGLDNRPLFGETSAKVSAAPDAGLSGVSANSPPPAPGALRGPSAGPWRALAAGTPFIPLRILASPLGSLFGTGLAESL